MSLTPSNSKLLPGESAPFFRLPNANGGFFSLDEALQDKGGALVVFICNHCPYVVPKVPILVELQTTFPSITVLGISSNDPTDYPEDSFENMEKAVRKKGYNFPYLFDEDQSVAVSWGAVCTPDPFLLDKKGKLYAHGRLDPEHKAFSDGRDMSRVMRALLAGEPAPKLEHSLGCSIKWKPELLARMNQL